MTHNMPTSTDTPPPPPRPPPPPQTIEDGRGVLSSSPSSSNNDLPNTTNNPPDPVSFDKAYIDRLGRQRPASLPSAFAEAGFVLTVVVSMMMSEFFVSGFNIILPFVADAIHIPESARTWPAAVINLTIAAFLLPFSRLCDRYGGRIVFLGGHAWYLVWSLACGFVGDANVLIVCRAMQGIGASAFVPAGLALLGQTYRPGPRKNLVFGVYGAFAVVGFYFGIILGGVAAEFLDWRWFFWIGCFLIFSVIASGLIFIPRHLGDGDPTVTMDWLGMCTIVPALTLIVFAFTDGGHAPNGWKTPYIYVTLILGVLLLIAAVYVQGWVSKNPLLPAELFRPKYMKRLCLALFCSYGVFGLFLFYASFYIETVLNAGPLQTAVWFTPMAVGGMLLSVAGGFVLHIISGRILMIISCAGFLVCVVLFATMPAQHQTHGGGGQEPSTTFLFWAYVFPAMIGATVGVDITFNVTNIFITTAMPRKLQAAASGLINSLLYLGISFWLGVGELAVSVKVQTSPEGSVSLREQYQIGMWVGVALALLSFFLIVSVRLGQASSQMTADEKAELAAELERAGPEACQGQQGGPLQQEAGDQEQSNEK